MGRARGGGKDTSLNVGLRGDGETADFAQAQSSAAFEFVYGCFINPSDDLLAPGVSMIAVSTRADWEDEGRFTDDYSEEEAAFIADAFNGCGFEAYEAMESMFELDGMDADTAREALRGVPGFTHSFEFEAAASGTV